MRKTLLKVIPLVILGCFLILYGLGGRETSLYLEKAQNSFSQGNFPQALKNLEQAEDTFFFKLMNRIPTSALEKVRLTSLKRLNYTIHFNKGVASYRLYRLADARGAFESALKDSSDNNLLAQVYYNLGNIQLYLGEDPKPYWIKALKLKPEDFWAKFNLEKIQIGLPQGEGEGKKRMEVYLEDKTKKIRGGKQGGKKVKK